MSVAVVTSLNQQLFVKYGMRCLHSFHERWPDNSFMVCYSEDEQNLYRSNRIHWVPLLEAQPSCHDFVKRNHAKSVPEKFRYDAVRFCFKVYALCDMLKSSHSSEYVVWLDADTYTHAPIPRGFVESLMPSDCFVGYLGRGDKPTESGFLVFNRRGFPELSVKFAEAYQAMYDTDALFALKEWHDGYIFDYVRRKMQVPGFDLGGPGIGHPFIHSKLGRYIDHLKGEKRKVAGRSPKKESIHSDVEYWK